VTSFKTNTSSGPDLNWGRAAFAVALAIDFLHEAILHSTVLTPNTAKANPTIPNKHIFDSK
jgi:hypothetical protein